jgi:hypothetical protein
VSSPRINALKAQGSSQQRHVLAKGLAIGKTIDYRLKPLIDRFGDRVLADVRTADIEDFIADLKLSLAQVRDLLGHASITTTERYDNEKLENLQAAVLKIESGKTFDSTDASRTKTRVDDEDKVSRVFQDQAKVPKIDDQKIDRETEPYSEDGNDLGDW